MISIDPGSYSVVGGSAKDERLWLRMQALRYRDPGVKLWLAIGGWTFNDDDQPTRTTFSDIVGNEAIGDKFIYSLIRVMQVYGFDGVDLDWYVFLDSRRRAQ